MFFQDDYPYSTTFAVNDETFDVGLQKELSCSSFIIFDKTKLKNIKNRWDDYLGKKDSSGNYLLPRIHINQYTGTMIEAK
jgi:hypothetical protein